MILQVLVFALSVSLINGTPELSPEDLKIVALCLNKHQAVKGSGHPISPKTKDKCAEGCIANTIGLTKDTKRIVDLIWLFDNLNGKRKAELKQCLGTIKPTNDCKVGKDLYDCQAKMKKTAKIL